MDNLSQCVTGCLCMTKNIPIISQCGKCGELKDELPMGVSQWKKHGIKYSYDKYFKIKWKKNLKS